jgi:hypothetical protein
MLSKDLNEKSTRVGPYRDRTGSLDVALDVTWTA